MIFKHKLFIKDIKMPSSKASVWKINNPAIKGDGAERSESELRTSDQNKIMFHKNEYL